MWCQRNTATPQHTEHSLTADSDANSTVFQSMQGHNLVMCLLEFSSEIIPNFNSYFPYVLSIFVLIQFSFLK